MSGAQPPRIYQAALPIPAGGPRRGIRMRGLLHKDWDRHVRHADELSRTPGFQQMRDTIIARAKPAGDDRVLDIGTGTGLLALPLAAGCAGVWAVDISPAMVEQLRWLVAGRGIQNLYPLIGSSTSLPLEDGSVDLVVSNYCFHHLDEAGKRRSVAEAMRVLAPDGRFVFGDMMFGWSAVNPRNRRLISSKLRSMARKGPAGFVRIARNAFKVLTGTGERPAPPQWWREALEDAGFSDVSVECLAHEGGVAVARKPG